MQATSNEKATWPRYRVEIYEREKDATPVETCEGPTLTGACPRQHADGTIACRARFLAIFPPEGAPADEKEYWERLKEWRWHVDGQATICPLAAMGLY